MLVLRLAAACLALGAVRLDGLSVVTGTVSDFSQDETRGQARTARVGQAMLDERLNPDYLKRHNLDPSRYIDNQNHFSPTGADWDAYRPINRSNHTTRPVRNQIPECSHNAQRCATGFANDQLCHPFDPMSRPTPRALLRLIEQHLHGFLAMLDGIGTHRR